MPGFSLAVRREAFDDQAVAADTHKGRKNRVSALSNEEEETGLCGGKPDYFVEVNDEIGEPNGGAQIVEDVAGAVWYPLSQRGAFLGIRSFAFLIADEKLGGAHFGVFWIRQL